MSATVRQSLLHRAAAQTGPESTLIMVKVDLKTLTGPIGILRILEFILTCVTFSLVASVGTVNQSFWVWCMFSWCFCFAITFLILILELFGLNSKIPISWSDFTAAYSMLATLMVGLIFLAFKIPFLFSLDVMINIYQNY